MRLRKSLAIIARFLLGCAGHLRVWFSLGRYMVKKTSHKFLKQRGQCIFCELRPPTIKMTKEHVFGEWLRTLFPRDAATTHTHGIVSFPIAGSSLTHPVTATRQGQGHSGSKKVRVVCRTCNNGWLSAQVEGVAKPILTTLITGTPGLINTDMQRILATSAAKTVMTAEHINRGKAVVKQADRTLLKDNLVPPPGWHVWIGSYSGVLWRDLGIFQHTGKLEIPSVDNSGTIEHNLELTLIGAGQLIFLVINSSWQRIWDILNGLGNPGGGGLERIWPIIEPTISWPRPHVLTDVEAEYFTNYLARVLEQPAHS